MRIASLIFCLLLSFAGMAQQTIQGYTPPTKAQLEAKRKEILDAINETEKQLEAIKSDKKATLGQLHALQNKLAERQRLIGNINDEIDDIDNTIKLSSREVGSLKQKLEQMKVRYAQSIRYAYETRSSYDMLAFLFSSADFNDAMRRMKYLKKFRDFRKQQVEQIRITQAQLQHKIGTLNAEKAQKDELLTAQVQQKQVLVKETDQTNQVINDLKGKESNLMRDIEKNRKVAERVDKAINQIIEREMAKATKAAEEEEAKANGGTKAKPYNDEVVHNNTHYTPKPKVPRGEVELMMTPRDVALANNFEGNKGKLYWPVEKGFVTDHFGTHPHPIQTKVMIENNGIDIRTTPDATVKAVFDGEVSSVNFIGDSPMIIIKHGNYFTVYTNLASASVKKDQHVTANQGIGTVANNEYGEPTVKFQIWKAGKKGSVKLNPEQWIGKAH